MREAGGIQYCSGETRRFLKKDVEKCFSDFTRKMLNAFLNVFVA